jgi:hypothetical protein
MPRIRTNSRSVASGIIPSIMLNRGMNCVARLVDSGNRPQQR